MDFTQACLKISGVYHKTGRPMTSQIPQPLAKQGFDTWHKSATMWKTLWCLSHWETHDNPTTSKIAYGWYRGGFCWRVELFLSDKGDKITCTSRIFSNMNVNCTWSRHWHLHNATSLLPFAPWTKLANEIGQWMIILSSRDSRLCHFCSYNAECPQYNPIKDRFPSLFEKVGRKGHIAWVTLIVFFED